MSGENITRSPYAQVSEQSQLEYIVNHLIGKEVNTCALVQVVKVTAPQTPLGYGFLDVQPLVNQLSANNQSIAHSIIHNVPYFRYQAGSCAVIIDPVVGDIGLCLFAQNDISAVKKTGKQAPPLSYRRFDYADGVYLGGLLNGVPTTLIQLIGGSINITSPTKVSINTPLLDITGRVKANGKFIDDLHYHNGVQPGSGNSGTVV